MRAWCNREVNFEYGSKRRVDEDDDGESTRQEVFPAESWVPVVREAQGNVAEGLCVGPRR